MKDEIRCKTERKGERRRGKKKELNFLSLGNCVLRLSLLLFVYDSEDE